MAFQVRNPEKAKGLHEYRVQHDAVGGLCSLGSMSPNSQRDQERKIRREIANSNERRRMQSINSGFQSLKTLLPHADGEKLSKAAILQQTSDYIFNLEQDKTRLLQQNTQMKAMLSKRGIEFGKESPPKRRKNDDSISSDEGIGSPEMEELSVEEMQKEMVDLRQQLDRERRLRMLLEEQNRSLEAQLYPEKLREIAKHVQLQEQQKLLESQRLREIQAVKNLQLTQPPVPVHIIHNPPVITATNTARQNLDAIVQAIRHLEGAKATPTPEDDKMKHYDSDDDDDDDMSEKELAGPTDIVDGPMPEVQTEEIISTSGTVEVKHEAVTVELLHPQQFGKPQELTSTPGIFVS